MSEPLVKLSTPRLDLVATTADHLRIELDSPHLLGEALFAEVPLGWPPGLYDHDAMRFFLAQTLAAGEAALGWLGWYMIRRTTDHEGALLVGSAGYFGPPAADGIVEIGYSVVEEARGKGYAAEAAGALTQRALAWPGVTQVVAEAKADNYASHKVLLRCGFTQTGAGREPDTLRFACWKRIS